MKKLTALLLPIFIALSPVLAKNKDKDSANPDKTAAAVDPSIPDTADALWQQVDAQRKALGDAITANNKDDVHKAGPILAKLLKAAPKKYPDLSGLKQKSVHHQAKAASHLCSDLVDAFDQGKTDQVTAILGQIDGAIKFVKDEIAKK
jgi:hypothetical protein